MSAVHNDGACKLGQVPVAACSGRGGSRNREAGSGSSSPWARWRCRFLELWTATLEGSTCSADDGRLHLHVFMEFARAVDWSSLRAVVFNSVTPNAAPRQGRWSKQWEVMNHGHFYVFANKAPRLAMCPRCVMFVDSSGCRTRVSRWSLCEVRSSGCSGWYPQGCLLRLRAVAHLRCQGMVGGQLLE